MIIGIDASHANQEAKTGVEWYGYCVIRELAAIDRQNDYRLYTKEPLRGDLGQLPANFQEVLLPHRRFWTYTSLARELVRHRVDVFYSPCHILPFCGPGYRAVATIHDAGFRMFKENYSAYDYWHATLGTWLSAGLAQSVIVPSGFVARDVATHYRLRRDRLVVVPNACEAATASVRQEEGAAARRALGIRGRYFVFVGRLEKRKNLLRALAAFFDLARDEPAPIQFVLAGKPGVGYEEIRALIAGDPLRDRVVETGYVSNRLREILLHGAEALVYPSLYEGFGMPILEGFAAGTPVLTSDDTACAEVGGDAAVLVDPRDGTAIRGGMSRLLHEDALREMLVERGRRRVAAFSWRRTASEIHGVLTGSRERGDGPAGHPGP